MGPWGGARVGDLRPLMFSWGLVGAWAGGWVAGVWGLGGWRWVLGWRPHAATGPHFICLNVLLTACLLYRLLFGSCALVGHWSVGPRVQGVAGRSLGGRRCGKLHQHGHRIGALLCAAVGPHH